MFVVTMVFLVGLIFTVQQLLFQYASVNPREGFLVNEYGVMKGAVDAVNATIMGSPDCSSFRSNLDNLKSFLGSRGAVTGYSIEIGYNLSCDYWGNIYPNPAPVNVSVRVLGNKIDSTSRLRLYKQ
jgi:hypothetical protein